MNCWRKRYNRAEHEFIEAKTDLHSKSEAKDLLTEHLYTVIHQNEVRKARKLAELTHKLELEDDVMVDGTETVVPVPLCLVMPMNQLTSHSPMSPSSTAASKHMEQSPPPADDASNTQQTGEPLQAVDSNIGHETAVSSSSQSAAVTDSVTATDCGTCSAVPSTDAAAATN